MIKKLNSGDNMLLNVYLNKMPMYSMFFMADIEKLDPVIYGCFEGEHLCCIFTKIINTLFVYSASDTIPAKEITEYLEENNIDFSLLKAQEKHVLQFEKYTEFTTKHSTLLCKLAKEDFKPVSCKDVNIVRAGKADHDTLMGFFNGTVEYKGVMSMESLYESISHGVYMLYEGKNIAGVAICNFYNRHIANISVLTTSPTYRGKGYGTKLLSYSCQQLLVNCDSVSICYEHTNSDKIYKSLGFKEIGKICMCIR